MCVPQSDEAAGKADAVLFRPYLGHLLFRHENALDAVPVFFLLAIRFTARGHPAGAGLLAALEGLYSGLSVAGGSHGRFPVPGLLGADLWPGADHALQNAFLTAVYCVIVPFLTWAVVGRKPDRYNIAAALLCVTGVGLVSLTEQLSINTGDLLTLVCACFYASHIVAVAKVSPGKDITLLTVFQFAFAALFAWVGGGMTETFPAQALADPAVFLPLAYLCVMATTVALLFQNVGSSLV